MGTFGFLKTEGNIYFFEEEHVTQAIIFHINTNAGLFC